MWQVWIAQHEDYKSYKLNYFGVKKGTWVYRELVAGLPFGWEQEAADFSFISIIQIKLVLSVLPGMSNNDWESLYLTPCCWCRGAGWSGSVMHPELQWQSKSTTCRYQTCNRLWHPRHMGQGRQQGPACRWHDTAASWKSKRCSQSSYAAETYYSQK